MARDLPTSYSEFDENEVVPIEVGDIFDLHPFRPRDIPDVVREYLDIAVEKGFRHVRLIHGKGIGVQRERVRAILAADSRVEGFGDLPAESGGWGATWVDLKLNGS
jgi:dsDNA-specific endonuclease/ATPase MutS2